ncbi:MAG: glycosyltransferase family 2 protein [Candidatus Kapaibacteriales bacterium]
MKISVVIVTRNRLNDLRIVLPHYFNQTWKNKEIIIVDNASTDGTKEVILKEFPDVKYFWLPENFDVRSILLGVHLSGGDVIWRCDSDSYPENPFLFEKIVDIFQKFPWIDIIACENIEIRRGNEIWHWYGCNVDKINVPEDGYISNGFAGGGAAIRRKVFDVIGGFEGFGYEEYDFSARAIINGFNIRYFPNLRFYHIGSFNERNRGDRWVSASMQFIRYTWKYFPFWNAIGRTILILIFQIFEAIWRRIPFKAFIEGFFGMIYVIFKTIRTERNVAPHDKLKIITLDRSLLTWIFYYYRNLWGIFKKKIQK